MTKHVYDIHGLEICSDIDLPIPKHFRKQNSNSRDLSIEFGNVDHDGMDPVSPPYAFFKKNKLVHSYGFPLQCKLSIENLESNTRIRFTRLYRKLVGVDEIVRYVIDIKMLQKGYVNLHGACVSYNGKGIILAGWDGCGKSTISHKFMEKGAEFLSDDTVMINESHAYSYPKQIRVFRGVTGVKGWFNKIPFVNKVMRIYEKKTPQNILDKSKVDYIFIARYGNKRIRKLSTEEILRAMNVLSLYSTRNRDPRNLVLAYCFHNDYDIVKLISSRESILKKFLRGVRCYEIHSKNTSETMELMEKTIG